MPHRIKLWVSFAFIPVLVAGVFFISDRLLPHLSRGLVGWWKFDEGAGTTAGDSSGNGRTGTLMNGATWIAGKIGGAVNLDGMDGRVEITGDPLGTGAMTFSAWIHARSFSNTPVLVSSGVYPDTQLYIDPNINNALCFTNDGSTYATSDAIQLNTWLHIVVVRNASNQVTFYVNGVQSRTANQTVGTPTGGTTQNVIGDRSVGGGHPFNGIIDDVRIYNRALIATDIQALYNSP